MPMDYKHTFHLLSLLSIVSIFRYFPSSVKDYAFYCRIDKHRVVFLDNNTNVLDLIVGIGKSEWGSGHAKYLIIYKKSSKKK